MVFRVLPTPHFAQRLFGKALHGNILLQNIFTQAICIEILGKNFGTILGKA